MVATASRRHFTFNCHGVENCRRAGALWAQNYNSANVAALVVAFSAGNLISDVISYQIFPRAAYRDTPYRLPAEFHLQRQFSTLFFFSHSPARISFPSSLLKLFWLFLLRIFFFIFFPSRPLSPCPGRLPRCRHSRGLSFHSRLVRVFNFRPL